MQMTSDKMVYFRCE